MRHGRRPRAARGSPTRLGPAVQLSAARISDAIRVALERPLERDRRCETRACRPRRWAGACALPDHLDGVRLRPARWSDGPLLLKWANDPKTRRQSLSPDRSSMDAHLEWLRRNLDDPDVDLLVAENGLGPVGVLRLAPGWSGELGRSINVAPERRGGIGTLMLQAAVSRWDRRYRSRDWLPGSSLETLPSQRTFARVGFRRRADAGETIVYSRPPPARRVIGRHTEEEAT